MTMEYHFVNFYDSGLDNQNESSICDDNQDLLNVAFLDSPENSISCLFKEASRNDLANAAFSGKDNQNWISNPKRKLMPRYSDLYTEMENLKTPETYETLDASEGDEGNSECIFTSTCLDEFQNSPKKYDWSKFGKTSNRVAESKMTEKAANLSKEKEAKPECTFTSTCLDEFPKLPKEYNWSKFEKTSNRVAESKMTEKAANLSKEKEAKPECIFTSTCLDEFPKSSKEYDLNKFEKNSNGDDESEKIEPKIPVPVYNDSRFYYVPHELSTILEVDSLLMDESVGSIMNSDKCSNLLTNDLKSTKCLETEDSLRNLKKLKPPNFSANVMKVIQNSHIEKLLQEPGILEESDLTLISSDFDTTCNMSEKSTEKAYSRRYNKSKHFSDVKSASLISFLQHELSCMNDCNDE